MGRDRMRRDPARLAVQRDPLGFVRRAEAHSRTSASFRGGVRKSPISPALFWNRAAWRRAPAYVCDGHCAIAVGKLVGDRRPDTGSVRNGVRTAEPLGERASAAGRVRSIPGSAAGALLPDETGGAPRAGR